MSTNLTMYLDLDVPHGVARGAWCTVDLGSFCSWSFSQVGICDLLATLSM